MTSPDEPAAGKVCTKCGEWKPWDGFSRDSRSLDRGGSGYQSRCKLCNREYREMNRDQVAERKRKYVEMNRDRVAKQKRNYYEANQHQIAEYHREYRDRNRDRIAKRKREYREANRDRIADYKLRYRKANRDRLSEKDREYHRKKWDADPIYRATMYANTRARRAVKRSLPSETVLLREIALRDGATCWMCEDELSEWNPAHLDHLVPLGADTDQLAAWSLDNPGTVRANMALACPSCNIRKSNRLMPCALARYLRNLSAESESLDEAC